MHNTWLCANVHTHFTVHTPPTKWGMASQHTGLPHWAQSSLTVPRRLQYTAPSPPKGTELHYNAKAPDTFSCLHMVPQQTCRNYTIQIQPITTDFSHDLQTCPIMHQYLLQCKCLPALPHSRQNIQTQLTAHRLLYNPQTCPTT